MNELLELFVSNVLKSDDDFTLKRNGRLYDITAVKSKNQTSKIIYYIPRTEIFGNSALNCLAIVENETVYLLKPWFFDIAAPQTNTLFGAISDLTDNIKVIDYDRVRKSYEQDHHDPLNKRQIHDLATGWKGRIAEAVMPFIIFVRPAGSMELLSPKAPLDFRHGPFTVTSNKRGKRHTEECNAAYIIHSLIGEKEFGGLDITLRCEDIVEIKYNDRVIFSRNPA